MQSISMNDFQGTCAQNMQKAREKLGLTPIDTTTVVKQRVEELMLASNSPTSETHQMQENLHDKVCVFRCLEHIAITGERPRFEMLPTTAHQSFDIASADPSTTPKVVHKNVSPK